MAKQPRNYKLEYAKRQAKAKRDGYRSYSQKRYQNEKAKKQQTALASQSLMAMFPDAVLFTELPKEQRKAFNRLEEYGISRQELNELLSAGPDFWRQARPMLERESELAKGTG